MDFHECKAYFVSIGSSKAALYRDTQPQKTKLHGSTWPTQECRDVTGVQGTSRQLQ